MFPARLDSTVAYDIAKAMMDGFNRHYRLFRTESARAKHRFETADWAGQQRAQRERIEFYDLRVRECSMRLEREFRADDQPMDIWQQVKLHYIGLLIDHHQPELTETFFNSVTTKILHRSYFQNDFIFVRPAVSTEYIENGESEKRPTYRAYYPTPADMQAVLVQMVKDFHLRRDFEDLPRDAALVTGVISPVLGTSKLHANFQLQVLTSLFYRNNPAVKEVFMKYHADLLDVAFWQSHKERIQAGYVYDVFPYDQDKRFQPECAETQVRESI